MIGSFGDVVFYVSRKSAKTFKDLKRSEGARYATHDIHLKKPKLEYLGPGLSNVSFTMEFYASRGMNPVSETDKLIRMQRNGTHHLFIVGNKRFGMKYFVLKSVSIDFEQIDNKGVILKATADVTLEEYL